MTILLACVGRDEGLDHSVGCEPGQADFPERANDPWIGLDT